MASDSTTSASSPSKADRNVANEAFNYLVQGKRHLLVRDIPSAVSSLQQACQLLTGHYGELGNECGDAYFYYGKALFEQAREETGVLGNAIEEQEQEQEDGSGDDDEDGDDDDQDEQQQEDGEEQEEEEEEQSDKSEELGDDEKDAPKKEESNNSEAQPVPATSTEIDPQPGTSAGGSGTNNKGEDEEEEISSLQLAWEVLELAKLIYSRQSENNREMQLKLADVHLHLGEVSLESGNFSEAIEDMQRCMRIQEELLPSDDRRIAETHYHLAIAYTYNNAHDQAIGNFKRACEVIETKIGSLKLITAGKEVEPGKIFVNEDDPVAVAQRDIDELTAILPEIKEKISDMDDAKKVMTLMNIAGENGAEEEKPVEIVMKQPTPPSEGKRPISNIGHLVKRKRKLDDDDKPTDMRDKKSRPDSTLEMPGTSSSSSFLPNDEVTESVTPLVTSRNNEVTESVMPLVTSRNNECRESELSVDSEMPSSSGSTMASKADAPNSTSFDDPVSSSTDCRAPQWSNTVYRSEVVQSMNRDTWNGEITQSESAANE